MNPDISPVGQPSLAIGFDGVANGISETNPEGRCDAPRGGNQRC